MLLMDAALTSLLILLFAREAATIFCDDCVNYNNGVCTNFGSCQGPYCLYEYVQNSNGQTMMKKSCLQTPKVQFDDGTALTEFNKCISKRTAQKSYIVKVCTDYNYCNRVCENPQQLNPLPPIPPPAGLVTCYQCTSNDGSDCMTGRCQGPYCMFILEQAGATTSVRKDCSDQPQITYDDGSVLTQLDTCDTRTTQNAVYLGQICTRDLCNGACVGPNGPVIPPQRQPIISCTTCEANNAYDCNGPTCQGNYCIYERQTPSTGVPYVKRSCALLGYVLYPDGTRSTTLNNCEYKLINGIRYATNVCSSGSFCNPDTCSGGSAHFAAFSIAAVFSLLLAFSVL